jgi:predicted alpha/beta-fold hydrolase
MPILYYNTGDPDAVSKKIVDACPSLHRRYWPLVWCTNSHLNAMFGVFLWHFGVVKYEQRILVSLHDGGQVSLDLLGFKFRASNDTTPTLLVLHGLTGDSHDFTRLALEAVQKGYVVKRGKRIQRQLTLSIVLPITVGVVQ